jgi:serine phosphatase RsbU (regulator of sigma subunit)
MVHAQQAETLTRARVEHELCLAQDIQQSLLPKELPALPAWQVTAAYRPARAVGGDFYDFLRFDDGRVGLVIGDVAGKGMPAALVMAVATTLLRGLADAGQTPGQVLQRVNQVLNRDLPSGVFVTCLYAILEPDSGRLIFANAGHNLPYLHTTTGVTALRATGMPLGLMADMIYEEQVATIPAGATVLFYSDGLVEAHNARRELFGGQRLRTFICNQKEQAATLAETLLNSLREFTGDDAEQEDDITLVALTRSLQG